MKGKRHEIEEAINSGASVSNRAYMYGSKVPPLFVAVMENNVEAVKVLLEHGANSVDGFIAAIAVGKRKAFKTLVSCGADINAANSNGHTPLLFALTYDYYKSPKIVKWLISLGADVNKKTATGYTPFTYLEFFHEEDGRINHELITILMNAGAIYDEAMIFAVKAGNIEFLRQMIHDGADVNKKCLGLQTPLAAAMFAGEEKINPEMIEFLAMNGAEINTDFELDEETITNPINMSISMNRPDIMKILISYGADVNRRDFSGRTPLVYAVLMGGEFAKFLLKNGADPDIPDKEGRTPLMLAALDASIDPAMLKILLKSGANVNAKDKDGMTALMWTVSSKDRSPGVFVSSLLRTGAIRAEGWQSWLALAAVYSAIRRAAQIDNIKLLLKYGADPAIKDNNGINAMMSAVMNFDDDVIELLREAGKSKLSKLKEEI